MFRASIPRVIATEIRWEEESSYTSIAMMYAALMEGVALQWDAGYVGAARNTRQKTSFKEYHERSGRHHGFSQTVHSLDDASRAMDAIVEQGEGANSTRVPVDFRPPSLEAGKEFDPGWFRGELSHYHKFSLLLHHREKLPEVHALIAVWEGGACPDLDLEA